MEHSASVRRAGSHRGAEFFWTLYAVPADEDNPSYVYTRGLSVFGHPELILFAATPDVAAAVLDELCERVRLGHQFGPGERVSLRPGDVHLLTFPRPAEWLYAASGRADSLSALLVVPIDELVTTRH